MFLFNKSIWNFQDVFFTANWFKRFKCAIKMVPIYCTSAVPVEHETLKSGRDATGRDGTRRDTTGGDGTTNDAGKIDVKVEIFM